MFFAGIRFYTYVSVLADVHVVRRIERFAIKVTYKRSPSHVGILMCLEGNST
jgi:hypothetical protein